MIELFRRKFEDQLISPPVGKEDILSGMWGTDNPYWGGDT